jgi:hypothetical protein
MLRSFDVPEVGRDAPAANRLLVGTPDPQIGRVVAAWSNVPKRPPRRKVYSGPMIGFGTLLGLAGLAGGAAAGSAALALLLLVAGGAAGAGLAYAMSKPVLSRQETCYLGEHGFQELAMRGAGKEGYTVRYEDIALLHEWVRRIRVSASGSGPGVNHGIGTNAHVISRSGDIAPRKVALSIVAAVREEVVSRRLRAHAQLGTTVFPVIRGIGVDGAIGVCAKAGTLTLTRDDLAVEVDRQRGRIPLHKLTARLEKGDLLLDGEGVSARIRRGEIADGVALEALLVHGGALKLQAED